MRANAPVLLMKIWHLELLDILAIPSGPSSGKLWNGPSLYFHMAGAFEQVPFFLPAHQLSLPCTGRKVSKKCFLALLALGVWEEP
jgi:hypothetical protein